MTSEQLFDLYVTRKKSIPDIASELQIPRSRARTMLLNAGVPLRSRKEGIQAVSHKLGVHMVGKPREFTPEWRANIAKAKQQYASETAAGVSVKTNGYVEYTTGPEKGRSVHVDIMERRIGRRLLPDEVVHHIDSDPHNNDINNLALMTRAAHGRLHRREDKLFLQPAKENHGIR